MTPDLAYGRHRGPARHRSRQAAVLVGLYPASNSSGDWIVPLTLRPANLWHHGGQISFPGGGIEPGDRDSRETATREFAEELGVTPVVRHWVGSLSTQYVFGSDHVVEPWIAVLETPAGVWKPDASEVAEVIELPLAKLLDPTQRISHSRLRRVVPSRREVVHSRRDLGAELETSGEIGYEMLTPGIPFGGNLIWGATAMILDELAQILH